MELTLTWQDFKEWKAGVEVESECKVFHKTGGRKYNVRVRSCFPRREITSSNTSGNYGENTRKVNSKVSPLTSPHPMISL